MNENSSYKTINKNILSNKFWPYFIIIIINTLFGLQFLNSFLSLLVNFLRERPNISLYHVAIYAFITFSIIFLAGFLFRFIKKRILFLIIIFSILGLRLIIQICRFGPVSLAASALGTVLWITSIAFFISFIREKKISLFSNFFPAMLFGFAINSGLNGLFGTWDMVWRLDPIIVFFLVLIIVIQAIITLIVCSDIKNDNNYFDSPSFVFYSLTAVLPFIFLQLYQFQNIAALNAKGYLMTAQSLSIIILSNVLAITSIYLIKIKPIRYLAAIISAVLLILSFWPEITGIAYIFQVVLGNIAGWFLMLAVFNKAVSNPVQKSPWKAISALGISGILLFVFAFFYYGSYDINLPLKGWMIQVFVAVLISLFGVLSVFLGDPFKNFKPKNKFADMQIKAPLCKKHFLKYIPVFLMISLFIIPALLVGLLEENPETKIQRNSVRLMHYNIHQGFNIDGYQDLESIARVIEKNGADIVCLNEVSRGWVINGSSDNFLWLAERLGMDYRIFMPASDSVWGNAILSKYPLELIKSGFLPRMDAPLRRSYIYASVDLSVLGIGNINVIATHLHQIAGEGEKREAQVEALLKEWGSFSRTAICGDFNAVFGDKEIQMLLDAGLVDSQAALKKQDQLTWVHYKPYRRIDYIWVTPDIEISDLLITYSRASDHLPVSLLAK